MVGSQWLLAMRHHTAQFNRQMFNGCQQGIVHCGSNMSPVRLVYIAETNYYQSLMAK
jgi:hypothetical protein